MLVVSVGLSLSEWEAGGHKVAAHVPRFLSLRCCSTVTAYDGVRRDVLLGHGGRNARKIRRGKVGDDARAGTLPLTPQP
jgi:hypothetical protein